jgi:hypothetical protein
MKSARLKLDANATSRRAMKRSQDDPRRIEALFNPHVGDKAWYAWLQLKGQ